MKLLLFLPLTLALLISPYIREGSGLKHVSDVNFPDLSEISPYIREGSGLKLGLFYDRASGL